MKRMIGIALCSILLICPAGCKRQGCLDLATRANDSSDLSARLTAIEKAVEAERQNSNIPGAALVIVKDDRVVLLKGFAHSTFVL
jgi:hypothetical protein